MLPLLLLCPFILAASAQRLRDRQEVGEDPLDDGSSGGLDYQGPLEFSFTNGPLPSSTSPLPSSTGAGAGAAGAVVFNDGTAATQLTGSAAVAYSAAEASAASAEAAELGGAATGSGAAAQAAVLASFNAMDDYYATVGSLTGSAAASETAEGLAEANFYRTAFPAAAGSVDLAAQNAINTAAYPTLTGAAAAMQASFASEDYYYATVGSLSGSAAAAASAEAIAEQLFDATVYAVGTGSATTSPAVTGSAASAAASTNAGFGSLDEYYATVASLTGAALSAENNYYATAYPPLTGSASAAYAAATAAANGPDQCGPKIPDPSVPDSCDTPVEVVDAPAAWGVQCLNDTGSSTPVNITSCGPLVVKMCSNQWQNLGQWTWLANANCAIGSFLPNITGDAPGPTQDACEELIYQAMVDECQFTNVPWNLASVNIKVLPDDSADGSGQAVNAGYGSYIVAARQLRTLSDRMDCTWVPGEGYCQGTRCFPPSYYASRFQHPTACAALGSAAATWTPV